MTDPRNNLVKRKFGRVTFIMPVLALTLLLMPTQTVPVQAGALGGALGGALMGGLIGGRGGMIGGAIMGGIIGGAAKASRRNRDRYYYHQRMRNRYRPYRR